MNYGIYDTPFFSLRYYFKTLDSQRKMFIFIFFQRYLTLEFILRREKGVNYYFIYYCWNVLILMIEMLLYRLFKFSNILLRIMIIK